MKKKIWKYYIGIGMTAAGVAGLMGNLYAESALKPTNLQNGYEKKLSYADETYTKAVDSGEYTDFARDCAGYGLAQWTYHARKAALLSYAKNCGKSIGDPEMQLQFLHSELTTDYPKLLELLKTTNDVRTASDAFMLQFERPADTSEAARAKRAGYAQQFYEKFALQEVEVPVADKSVEVLAAEVIAGKWGNGTERRERLTDAGYDYAAVQALVNQMMQKTTHRVCRGDNLTKITLQYGTTIEAIIAANRKQYPAITADYIEAGWTLIV